MIDYNEKQNLDNLSKLLDTQKIEIKPESRVTKNGVCKLFIHSTCQNKEKCPNLHDMSKVAPCTLHAEGRCKFGTSCDFSHNLAPGIISCKNIRKNGICEQESCKKKHELKKCFDYEQGYCFQGPFCAKAQVRKIICINYQYGFCANGPKCKDAHPKNLLVPFDEQFFKDIDPNIQIIKCFDSKCQKLGHKSNNCPQKMTVEIDSICLNCNKWHYKDNKCPAEDPFWLMSQNFANKQQVNKNGGGSNNGGVGLNTYHTINNNSNGINGMMGE